MTAHIFWNGGWWDGPGILAILGTIASGIFWILFFAVMIKLLRSRPFSIGSPPSALRILEERYARGEISHDEFVERRAVLLDEVPRSSGSSVR